MNAKQIIFTGEKQAELITEELPEPGDNEVTIKKAFSTISAGTEKANLLGMRTVDTPAGAFPRRCGYCGAGTVVKVGKNVTDFNIGDRVIHIWGNHKSYANHAQESLVKIPDDVSFRDASMLFISTFPMAAVRKVNVELGESGMVVGLGILGMFGIAYLKAAGAVPLIAADPNPERREMALKMGADYAFDPLASDFAEQVKAVTNGGVNVCIEVTGFGSALNEALDCMAKYGRVALLGCTRDSNFIVDYYEKVHFPGVQLIGAHTLSRPEKESFPGCWTHQDDIKTALKLLQNKRLDLTPMYGEMHSPNEAPEVFRRLADDKNFPVCVQFDWSMLEE